MRFRFIIEGVVDADVTHFDAHPYDLIANSLEPVTVDIVPIMKMVEGDTVWEIA